MSGDLKPLTDPSVDITGWVVWGKKGRRCTIIDRAEDAQTGEIVLIAENLNRPIKLSEIVGYESPSEPNADTGDSTLYRWFLSWQVPDRPFTIKPNQIVTDPKRWAENTRAEIEKCLRGEESFRAKAGLLQVELSILKTRDEWLSRAQAIALITDTKLNSRNEFGVQWRDGTWNEIGYAMRLYPLSELQEIAAIANKSQPKQEAA